MTYFKMTSKYVLSTYLGCPDDVFRYAQMTSKYVYRDAQMASQYVVKDAQMTYFNFRYAQMTSKYAVRYARMTFKLVRI